MDMIWWDNQCYNGRGAKSEYASEELNLGPANEMEAPCGDCSNYAACRANGTDCVAFRDWTNRGKYSLADSKGRSTIGLRLKQVA